MRRTLLSLAALAALALAACNGSSTDTVPGGGRFDSVIGSGTRSSESTGQGELGGGTRAESDTTGHGGGGTIGSGT